MTISVDNLGQNETRTARDSLRDADQEQEFASLLGSTAIVDKNGKGGERGALSTMPEQFQASEAPVVIRKAHEALDEGNAEGEGSRRGNRLRAEAAEMRQEAENLNNEADILERRANSDDGAISETVKRDLLNEAELLRNRAATLESRAEAFEQRADAADDRVRIERAGNQADLGIGHVANESNDVGWLSEEELEAFELALSQVSSEDLGSFENIEINSSRLANESEIEIFLSVAEQMGASEEDLMLLDGYADAFPIQIVFVDNLISEYGVETAAGGAVNVLGTTTILMDSSFKSDDLTTAGPGEAPSVVNSGFEALIFSLSVIVEGIGLFPSSADHFMYNEVENNEERNHITRSILQRDENAAESRGSGMGISFVDDTDPDA